jgi:hypothetical protein
MRGPLRRIRPAERIPLVALGVAAAVVIGVSAVAFGSSAPPQPTPPEAGGAQLAVFSRPATPTDSLPSLFANQLQAWDSSASPELAQSRRVTASDGQSAYVVPTASGGICVVNANESFCSPADHSAGASAVDLCSPSLPLGQMEVEWLLPDAASNVYLTMSDGSQVNFPFGNNVYITRLPLNATSPVPSAVVWTAGGQVSQVSMPVPANAQTEQCEHPSPTAAASTRERRRSSPKVQFKVEHHLVRLSGSGRPATPKPTAP